MSLRFGKIQDRQDVLQMNALQLAYLGDTVWELIVRYELINLKYNVRHMHKSCVEKVNANAQAQILMNILDVLTDEERSVVQRGRNAHPGHAAPRNQNPEDYTASTGFEALLGYLYMTGQDNRIQELVEKIKEVNSNV